MNKDEAQRCINIAKRCISEGNNEKAEKFLKKSLALHESAIAKGNTNVSGPCRDPVYHFLRLNLSSSTLNLTNHSFHIRLLLLTLFLKTWLLLTWLVLTCLML